MEWSAPSRPAKIYCGGSIIWGFRAPNPALPFLRSRVVSIEAPSDVFLLGLENSALPTPRIRPGCAQQFLLFLRKTGPTRKWDRKPWKSCGGETCQRVANILQILSVKMRLKFPTFRCLYGKHLQEV